MFRLAVDAHYNVTYFMDRITTCRIFGLFLKFFG